MEITVRDPMAGLIHFVGALLSVAALVLMVSEAGMAGKPWHIVSYSIFGVGLIGLYSASTLCHWFEKPDTPNNALEKFDHIMIYVLIASTYTPICLIPIRGAWGWSVFGIVWALAIAGSVLKLTKFHTPRWVTSGIYVAMGWVFLVAIVPISQTMPFGAMLWLMIGGGSYTLGAVVYAIKKPDFFPEIFGYHEIFHILVIAGSFSFFWIMYSYLIHID